MNERSFSPTPLNKRSLSDEIVFQIKEMIADGRLQPNQKLPTEQELCQAFSVGRTTVREALMGLTALGLVRRDKHNSYVTDAVEHPLQEFYLHLIMDNYDIAQLYEARLMLEGSVIRLACRRAAPEQIRRLEELTEQMQAAADALRFEYAASLRDRLRAIQGLQNHQRVIATAYSDTDAVGFQRGAKCCFTVLHFTDGNLTGKDKSGADGAGRRGARRARAAVL